MSTILGYRVRPVSKTKQKCKRKEGRKGGRQTRGIAKSLKCLLCEREDPLSDPQHLCYKKPSLEAEISLLVKQGQSGLSARQSSRISGP